MQRDSYIAPMEVKFADEGQPGVFEGYGAVFGNIDAYGDVIQKGAFKETLRDWRGQKRLPPMLIQHGGFGLGDMDGLAIGKWTSMEEDDTGLKVSGKLISLDTERGKIIHGAMKEGVLDGMSIGYRAKEFALGAKPDEPRRTLKKIDLIELSVVQMPANGKARVRSVKSLTELTIEDFRDIEATYRTMGLSQRDAAKAITGLKNWLQRDVAAPGTDPRDEGTAGRLAALVRRNIATLTA